MAGRDKRRQIFNGDREILNREDPIFPIVRENAPLLERVRNQNTDQNVAEDLGKLVGQIVKTDDLERLQETREDFTQGFRNSLAKELGVSDDDINESLVTQITDTIVEAKESDALRQQTLEDLGVVEGSEETEAEESNESEEDTSEPTGEQTELFESEESDNRETTEEEE